MNSEEIVRMLSHFQTIASQAIAQPHFFPEHAEQCYLTALKQLSDLFVSHAQAVVSERKES